MRLVCTSCNTLLNCPQYSFIIVSFFWNIHKWILCSLWFRFSHCSPKECYYLCTAAAATRWEMSRICTWCNTVVVSPENSIIIVIIFTDIYKRIALLCAAFCADTIFIIMTCCRFCLKISGTDVVHIINSNRCCISDITGFCTGWSNFISCCHVLVTLLNRYTCLFATNIT